jgi:carboxyl-terminal processing protease
LNSRTLLAAFAVAVAFVAGSIAAVRTDGFGGLIPGAGDSTSQALELIEADYYKAAPVEELQGASVSGMVEYLRKRYDDRFSRYFGPWAYQHFQDATAGQFSGVGMTVGEVPAGLRVARVFPDSPAQKGGIVRGDVVTAVDGKSIAGLSAELATNRIKGEEGTDVTLTVRSANGKQRDIELTRAQVALPIVEGKLLNYSGEKIAYVRMTTFSTGVHGLLRGKVESLYERGAKGLILDLRDNGGGLLSEAVLASSQFIENGPIVSTSGRAEPEQVYEAEGDALPRRPMAVLINENTASAAEIMAAALAQAKVATTVGTTSFGKGTFQRVFPLENGGALDLTLGEYLTRNGSSVDGKGLKPQVIVTSKGKTDLQLRRAEALVARKIRAQAAKK